MNSLYLYDDQVARRFEPFALTRPASELRAGAEITRRRWEVALDARAVGFVGAPHLALFSEFGSPRAAREAIPAGAVIANARCLPQLTGSPNADAAGVWICGGEVAAVRLSADVPIERFTDGTAVLDSFAARGAETVELSGRWLDEVWALVRDLPTQLGDDIAAISATLRLRPVSALAMVAHVIGPPGRLHIEHEAIVEPYTVFDTGAGPILIRRGATVHAFTRVVGPCYVGEESSVTTDRIASCSIGERCRVHGEMSMTVMLGHTNKGHDGFVGHSYLGRWVNLGAGTITSNLKNTYGTVALWTPDGVRDTGLQFLGTLLGDHAKTGIGLRLTTGSVVGAGANVYGSTMPDKLVPPFSWGEASTFDEYRVDKFLEVAERVMARRGVVLDEDTRAHILAVYDHADHARGR